MVWVRGNPPHPNIVARSMPVERRKAIGLATAVSLVGASSAFAVGANFGLFGLAAAEGDKGPALPIGAEAAAAPPVPPPTVEEVQVIDVPVAAAPTSASPTSPASSPSEPAVPPALPPASDDVEGMPPPEAAPSPTPHTEAHREDEAEDGPEHEPCEVHDDGLVECHDHGDD
jgi:hypothetical protein